ANDTSHGAPARAVHDAGRRPARRQRSTHKTIAHAGVTNSAPLPHPCPRPAPIHHTAIRRGNIPEDFSAVLAVSALIVSACCGFRLKPEATVVGLFGELESSRAHTASAGRKRAQKV